MQILPVKETNEKNWIRVNLHSISLRQIEQVLHYLGFDWSGVKIIKDNVSYDDVDELKRHYPVQVKYLQIICYGISENHRDSVYADIPQYDIEIKKGTIRIIQYDDSLGKEPFQNVLVYLGSQQKRLDKRDWKHFTPVFLATALAIGPSTAVFVKTPRNPWIFPIMMALVAGLASLALVATISDYTACIRIEGSTHLERNKEHYLKLVFLIVGAILSALAMWIFGCKG